LSDGTVFKYDLNGNMVKVIKGRETTSYAYDAENRLKMVTSQTVGQAALTIAQYYYDGDGGRTKRIVYRRNKAVYNANSIFTLFEKNNQLFMQGTVAKPTPVVTRYVGNIYEEEGPSTSSGLRRSKFIYLGNTRVAEVSGGDIMYYHTDHLGGTNVLS